MGWSEYSTTAKTNSGVLKERIRKAFFHFKGPHTWKHMNFRTKKVEEETEEVEFDFIDLAVLLGIRETCYQQEGDTPLSKEEVVRFLKTLNKQHVIHHYIAPVEENRAQSLDELISYFNEWDERLVTGNVTENEDGSVEIYLNAQTYMGLWMALTTVYPGSEIDVWEYEDYDNGDDWYESYDRFTVKYGTRKQTDHTYDEGSWNWDEDEESESGDNEEPAKEPSPYDVGMDYAYKGEYEKSIEILSTLEGNVDALNNIGVDYERLGQNEKAYEYYLKANTPWSLDNLLGLYNNSKIPMNVEDYTKVCDHLIEIGDYHGYTYMTRLYSGKHSDVSENGQLSLEYAKKGYEMFPDEALTIFNYAWCLCEYAKSEEDKQKSHKLYESILFKRKRDDGTLYLSARHNYAWQCQVGDGCEKDISKAIYWYKKAFEEGHAGCANDLAYIYETEEGYINQEFADFWKQQYKENGGEED